MWGRGLREFSVAAYRRSPRSLQGPLYLYCSPLTVELNVLNLQASVQVWSTIDDADAPGLVSPTMYISLAVYRQPLSPFIIALASSQGLDYADRRLA